MKTTDKNLSYRRETARQLPTWRGRGLGPPAPLLRPHWLHIYVWSNPKPPTNVGQACRPLSRAAVGMGIPMGIPMGMGMGWVWGL